MLNALKHLEQTVNGQRLSPSTRTRILSLTLQGAERSDVVRLASDDRESELISNEFERLVLVLNARERAKSRGADKAAWMASVHRQLDRQSGSSAVDVMTRFSAERFFEDYYFRNKPVLIRNLDSVWQAFEHFKVPALLQNYGDAPVEVTVDRHDVPGHDVGDHANLHTLPFREFAELLEGAARGGDGNFYMIARNHVMQNGLSSLMRSLKPFPGVLGEFVPGLCNLWIGPAGAKTHLHHDISNVLFVQVSGIKQFWFVAPHDCPYLYNTSGVFSEVNAEAPDFERFPLFRYAKVLTTTIRENEALLIPVGWWHQVRCLTESVSVSLLNFIYENKFDVAEFEQR